jgi:hypothetical protein
MTAQLSDSDGFAGYAAQLARGTWSIASLPFSGAFPYGQTSGTGRVFAEWAPIFDASTYTLWERSAGSWQQITNDTDQDITATADGSGLRTFNLEGATLGLYDAG